MTDLVGRLREGAEGTDVAKTDVYLNSVMRQAADEIERLRNALREIAEAADDEASGPEAVSLGMMAKEALGDE